MRKHVIASPLISFIYKLFCAKVILRKEKYLTSEASRRLVGKSPPPRRKVVEETYNVLRRLMMGLHGRMRRGLTERGMTLPQMFLLRFLVEKGTATPKELAGRMGVTPGNITGLVNKLEAAGLVTRSRGNKDRRVVELRPTGKAKRGVEAVHAAAVEGLMGAFERWSTDEIQRLKTALERIVPKN
jgi:DNA-binding MarR family transcriptional regulator